jgi:hypothetical protein
MLPYIIVTVILIITILFIIFKVGYDKLNDSNIKTNEGKETINVMLNKKLELTIKIIDEMEEISDNKYNDEFNMSDSEELDSVSLNKKLNEYYYKIIEIVEYNVELVLSDDGNKNLKKLTKVTLELIGVEKYYNENAIIFNKLLKRFPNNILGKMKKYNKLETYDNSKKERFEMLNK